MSVPGRANEETVEAMMARARALEASAPTEAGRVYAQALLAAPANLEAHNALERLVPRAPGLAHRAASAANCGAVMRTSSHSGMTVAPRDW